MRFLLLSVIIFLCVVVPIQSYAESITLDGNGFGIVNNAVKSVSLLTSLQTKDSESVFQGGSFSLDGQTFSINDMNLSLSNNKKILRLDASISDFTMTASGKLVTSTENNSIYYLTGKASHGESFSIFVKLQQQKSTSTIPESKPVKNLLVLVKQTERLEWKSPYKFTIRIFDSKSNPQSDFYSNFGYVDGIQVSVTVKNPLGDVIKTTNGMTQKSGFYEDSILIPDNARTGIYTTNVVVSGKDYSTTTKELSFVVIPLNTRPS